MANEETLEILWDHCHKQIDENKAIHKSLEEIRKSLDDFNCKKQNLLHKLKNLKHFVHGAHCVCDHENSGATFHQIVHEIIDIINWINENE